MDQEVCMKDKGGGGIYLRVIILSESQHLYMSRYSNTGIINVEVQNLCSDVKSIKF